MIGRESETKTRKKGALRHATRATFAHAKQKRKKKEIELETER